MNSAALIAVLLCSPAASSECLLVERGEARAAIVVPDEPSPTVRRAAEELAHYVERISGAVVPVVPDGRVDGRTRIDVGPTRRARAAVPPDPDETEERVFVRSQPGGVVICGGGDRGTLFAVYRFLEALGCRWLAPGDENEIVPRRATLTVEPFTLDTRPAFEWRLFKGTGEATRWGTKVGMNGLYSGEEAATNGNCYFYPAQLPSVHTWHAIIPNAKYFDEHPDWFPLRGGRRVPTDVHGSQLCVAAPGLVEQFAANVIRIFDENPGCRLTSISPNDGRGWCECSACTELDRRLCGGRTTRQGLAGEQPFRGDRVFWFANEVAARVAEKHPDKKLLVLAYINYAEPPDAIRPAGNVVPFVCHYAPADYARPIADPASEPNRQFDALLRRWTRITPEVLIYSYVSKSMWWRLPRPVLRPFAADVKHFHALGIRRYYCQSSLSDWPLDGPLYYAIARLLWDPSSDAQAIADEWIDGMFGPAAPDMAAFYEAVDAAVRKTGRPYSDNPPRDVPGLYDAESLDVALAALDRAAQAPADETVRRRVAEVARTYRYGYWMIRALEARRRFDETADPESLEAALVARDKAFGYVQVTDAQRRTASWEFTAEIGVPATGFGKAEIKGGRRCWNSDETGVGDGAAGWATFVIAPQDPTKPVVVEMDVWGESALASIAINTAENEWNRVRPEARLSGRPQWETLVFRIAAERMNPERVGQKIGFGGGDSQIWVANIRVRQP